MKTLDQHGFTLIDSLLAIVIMSLGLIGILGSINHMTSASRSIVAGENLGDAYSATAIATAEIAKGIANAFREEGVGACTDPERALRSYFLKQAAAGQTFELSNLEIEKANTSPATQFFKSSASMRAQSAAARCSSISGIEMRSKGFYLCTATSEDSYSLTEIFVGFTASTTGGLTDCPSFIDNSNSLILISTASFAAFVGTPTPNSAIRIERQSIYASPY